MQSKFFNQIRIFLLAAMRGFSQATGEGVNQMKQNPQLASDPDKLDDAATTIIRTPTTKRANEIRRRESSASGDPNSGVTVTKGQTPQSKAERDRLTGEAPKSFINK
jgi:hypothetical protein